MTVSMNPDNEEILLTAGKADSKYIARLERKHVSEVDRSKVHPVSSGPYKGLLINKKPLVVDNSETAEARLEFMAFLVDQEKNNEPLQDFWTLKFWFRGHLDGLTKKRTFTQYFGDLMNPTNFPKNYMNFMKKAMCVLRNYMLIRKVELEVEQVKKVQSPESSPQIKSFVSLFTPDIYQFNFVPEISMSTKTFLTFMVKAKCDAHIALSANYGELHKKTVEIVIGADSNTRSLIKDGVEGSIRAEALTANILSCSELRYFWLSWSNHHIEVGRGSHYNVGRFLEWQLPSNKQFPITSLAVATDNMSHGQFEFAELFVETDFSKHAKKSRIQKQIMWMAKKQRILHCLEDAYPNTLTVSDLMHQKAARNIDSCNLVMMLKELEKLHHIKEVEVGRWLRIQFEAQNGNGSGHDLKLVRDVPQLTGKEQPTVAIITSLYCEKLAVDAMIEDKTTFVKYKTEVRRSFVGESQVYTVGTIGRFKVVSTKLSRMPTSTNGARISAENTITRLLGTFNKVEHVFLVGVAGGVPHFTDYSKHLHLGDVVVSIQTRKNGPLYVHCSNVGSGGQGHGQDFHFTTRSFDCKDKTLQNVVQSLSSIVKSDWKKPKPWDVYIEEGLDLLANQETHFQRPASDKELMVFWKSDGTLLKVSHPKPSIIHRHENKPGYPKIRFGVVGSGRIVSRTHDVRMDFARRLSVKAYDLDFEAVLESLEGNRCESFLVIRGVCDYKDGTTRDWQPYASLTAAAYMKSVIMAL